MKKAIHILIVLLFFHYVHAQISGKILDERGEVVAWANVSLFQSLDSTIIDGIYSDEEGSFELETTGDVETYVVISFVGFENHVIHIGQSTTRELGSIVLREQGVSLDALSIVARRNPVKQTAEGTEINVKGSLMTEESNALQVLERSPGITINRQSANLQLNGSSGVRVFLNGREIKLSNAELIQYLEGLPGGDISKLKILTSPSSKYGADGNAGVIVIETERSDNSPLSGNLSVNGGYGLREKYGSSLRLSKGGKNGRLYGSYSYSLDRTYHDWEAKGSENFELLGGMLDFDVVNTTDFLNKRHTAYLGGQRNIYGVGEVGGEVSVMTFSNKPHITNNSIYDAPGEWTNAIIRTHATSLWNSYTGSTFFHMKNLDINVSGMQFSNSNLSSINNEFLDPDGVAIETNRDVFVSRLKGDNRSKIRLGSFNADYRIDKKSFEYEGGINLSISNLDNNTSTKYLNEDVWTEDERLKDENGMLEGILAGYSNWNFALDSLTDLQVGLRYEYWDRTYRNAGIEDQKKGALFPSIFLNKRLSTLISGNVSYVRRITRPTFNDLATTSAYNGPSSVFSGNPFLRAAISDRIKVGISRGAISASISGEHTTDPIVFYQLTESENRDLFILSPQNMEQERRFSIELNINNHFMEKWTGNIGLNLSRRYIEIAYTNLPFRGWYNTYSVYGNQNFDFGKGWSIELSGWINGRFYDGSKILEPFGMLNGGLRKVLGRNTFQVSFTDLLKTMKVTSSFGELTTEAFNVRSRVHWASESAYSRILNISYTYHLEGKESFNRKANQLEERVRLE